MLSKKRTCRFKMKQAGITQVQHEGKFLWPLTCSFDMAWQKRAAGKCYNSPLGHAFLVCCFSNKIIKCMVYSKGCTTCQLRLKKQGSGIEEAFKDAELSELPTGVTNHCCPLNFKGSAKSMDVHAAVSMVKSVFASGNDHLANLVMDLVTVNIH